MVETSGRERPKHITDLVGDDWRKVHVAVTESDLRAHRVIREVDVHQSHPVRQQSTQPDRLRHRERQRPLCCL